MVSDEEQAVSINIMEVRANATERLDKNFIQIFLWFYIGLNLPGVTNQIEEKRCADDGSKYAYRHFLGGKN